MFVQGSDVNGMWWAEKFDNLFFEVSNFAKQQTCTFEPCQSLSKYQKWGRVGGGGAMVWEGYVMSKAKQKHQA